jgi:ABC-2 type transport system permease protein
LLVASLPALGVVYLFGGVPIAMVIAALVVTISTALGYTALGLVLSAIFRRTAIATVLVYGVVMITTIALPILSASLGFTSLNSLFFTSGPLRVGPNGEPPPFGWPPAQAWLSFVSPSTTLLSVLGAQSGQGGLGIFSAYAVQRLGVSQAPELVASLSAWVWNALINLAFAALALLLAARWLSPRRPRKRRSGS